MTRACGDCQLCCRLLPVPPLGKKAGQRCQHQKFGTGCAVYNKPAMPLECSLWNCRWLVNDDTADLSRPDHAHLVVDITPDFISIQDNETGSKRHVQVVQIWCDPRYPEAHRDPALRRYLIRRAEEGIAALVRLNSTEAFMLFAPPFNEDGEWHEFKSATVEKQHSFAEISQWAQRDQP